LLWLLDLNSPPIPNSQGTGSASVTTFSVRFAYDNNLSYSCQPKTLTTMSTKSSSKPKKKKQILKALKNPRMNESVWYG